MGWINNKFHRFHFFNKNKENGEDNPSRIIDFFRMFEGLFFVKILTMIVSQVVCSVELFTNDRHPIVHQHTI